MYMCIHSLFKIIPLSAIIVVFEQSAYSVNEELTTVHPVLTLSNPSAIDITIQVINTDLSTSGKCISTLYVTVADVNLIPHFFHALAIKQYRACHNTQLLLYLALCLSDIHYNRWRLHQWTI